MMRFRLIGWLVLTCVLDRMGFATGTPSHLGACRAIVAHELTARQLPPPEEIFKDYVFDSLVMWNLIHSLLYIPEGVPVLILGETGVGKEFIARLIHTLSARRAGPYVVVDAGTLSEDLAASELFGHVKGAFTNAVVAQSGLLREAAGGTFFLDEVTILRPGVQRQLLRALQERVVRPVGGTETVPADFRFVSASNSPPDEMGDTEFRRDLFHRVGSIVVVVPPLRDRGADVVLLGEYFLKQLQDTSVNGGARFTWSSGALEKLLAFSWPGNVRQLKNEVSQALMKARQRITIAQIQDRNISVQIIPSDLFAGIEQARPPSNGNGFAHALRNLEHLPFAKDAKLALITEALRRVHGNRVHAAQLIGMNYRTLLRSLPEGEDTSSR